MITLTKSYQKVAEGYLGNTGYADVYLRLYAKYNSQSITDNTSSVSYKSTIYFGTGTFYSGTTTTKSIYGDGAIGVSGANASGNYSAGETTLNEITGTITHNDNGSKSVYTSANFTSTPWGWNVSVEASCALPTIARYATSNQSLNSKTETTITMNWSSDNTIDYLWYSKDGGTNWTGVDVTDGTSGTYKISGLTANTTYSIKTRVRRKDSQLTTDSSALSVTTYKVPSNSLNARTETTIKMNWSVDSTANYIWYSTDNGSNWTAVGSVSATSGTYTISGLSANTAYKVKTRVRRKATQTTYDASVVSVTTYNYPSITAVGTSNLTIGNSQTLTLYNPLSRTVTIKMYQTSTSGTQLYSGTTNSTSITFTPTASTLYASIPNAKSAKCVYSAVYSSSTLTTTGSYTYVIDESACKPTFTNFEYADISSTITPLTGNSSILVNNNSVCQFTVSTANKATAKNSASISDYKFEWGSLSATREYSSDSDIIASIYNSTGNTLKVTAIDSRGLSTTVTKTVPFIAYTNAVVNSVEVQRLNGVDLETYLGLKMTIWKGNWQNSSDIAYDNQLKYVGYRVYDGSSWTSYFDITENVLSIMSSYTSGSSTIITVPLNQKLAIHANGTSGGFTVGKEYTIQVLIKDGTSTATFTPYSYQATKQGIIPDGKVGLSKYKDVGGNYHYGINSMPEDDSALYVDGNIKTSKDLIVSYDKAGIDGSVPYCGSKVVPSDLTDMANNKTYFGSVRLNNITWYNMISTRHRNGYGDGASYGMLLYSNLTSSGNLMWNKQMGANNGWQGERTILDSSNYSSYALPKAGGILTGDLTINQSPSDEPYARIDNGTYQLDLVVGLSGNRGLYDRTNSKWLAYLSKENVGYFNGASTSIKVNGTNSTSGAWYYPTWVNTSGDSVALHANNGIRYYTLQGTTTSNGASILAIGNETTTGTDGNKYGSLRIHSKLNGFITLEANANSTTQKYAYFPDESGTVQYRATSLYTNTSGTTGTVTLSYSSANYTYLEIFYAKSTDYGYQSVKIFSPNGKRATLINNHYVGGSTIMQTLSRTVAISGTSISAVSNMTGYGNMENSTTKAYAGSETAIKIYKVIGYN